MRLSFLILLFSFWAVFLSAQGTDSDPELVELRQELERIQANLNKEKTKSQESTGSQFAIEPAKPENVQTRNNSQPVDESKEIRAELMEIQRELSKLGGQPDRTYYPSDRKIAEDGKENPIPVDLSNESFPKQGAVPVRENQPVDGPADIRAELNAIQGELNNFESNTNRTYEPNSPTQVEEVEEEKENAASQVVPDSLNPKQAALLELSGEMRNIRIELIEIQKKVDDLMGIPNASYAEELNPVAQDDEQFEEELNTESFNKENLPNGLGVYFTPFVGISKTEDLKWSTVVGDVDIEQKEGHSFGLRFGHSWNILFLDFQLSHYENAIEQLNVGGMTLDLDGEARGLAYHASIGSKIYITSNAFFFLAGGLGASDQSIQFDGVEEEDVLLSYQLFTGLEYFPTDHVMIGLRYRWMKMEGMNLFSSQELHLGELSLGYSH